MRKIIGILIILISFSVSAQDVSKESGDESVAKLIVQKNLRERHEWFAAAISFSPMGLGLRLSTPTIRVKGFFWESLTTEGIFPVWMQNFTLWGGALYTKFGYFHTINQNSDVRFSISLGGAIILGSDDSGTHLVDYSGGYLDPEISYVYSFNEKYAIQFGLSCPLLIPKIYPYPVRGFIGFRY